MVTFDISVDVRKIIDMFDKVDISKIANQVLQDGADDILSDAKSIVHVVSGDLKASGRVEHGHNEATVKFTKDYARAEEERVGGKYPGPHAYLEPSGDRNVSLIAKDLEDKINEAFS